MSLSPNKIFPLCTHNFKYKAGEGGETMKGTFISQGCCYKLPQTWWCKTTEIYFQQFWRLDILNLTGLCSLTWFSGKMVLASQLLLAPSIPRLLPPHYSLCLQGHIASSSPSLSEHPLCFSYKAYMIVFKPLWDNAGGSPHLIICTVIKFEKTLFLNDVTFSSFID